MHSSLEKLKRHPEGQGLTEKESLHFIAPKLSQYCQLVFRLHPFSHDMQVEVFSDANDGLDNGVGILRSSKVAHKHLIDLDPVYRETAQVIERRIARSKVIY